MSCAYLIKINPVTYKATGGTLWLAYLEDKEKPNSAWIDSLGHAPDRSVCFAGRAASSVIKTGNHLSEAKSGQHIVVLREDLSSIRYSSTIPGSGAIRIGNDRETWGICSGIVNGKQRVLYLCGAKEGDNGFKTPLKNEMQSKFGGGYSDGYAVLLEMSINKKKTVAKKESSKKVRITSKRGAEYEDFESKKRLPIMGQKFHFKSSKPKWVTVDAEFRSENKEIWPSFFYGKPETGSFAFNLPTPTASIKLKMDKVCQGKGDSSRRIMGELYKDNVSDLSFEVKSVGRYQYHEEVSTERGKTRKKKKVFAPVKAILSISGRRIEVDANMFTNFKFAKKSSMDTLQVDFRFKLDTKKLGIKKHTGLINCRISAVGYK